METVVIPFVVVVLLGNDNHVDFKTITNWLCLECTVFQGLFWILGIIRISFSHPQGGKKTKTASVELTWLRYSVNMWRSWYLNETDLVQSLVLKHNTPLLTALSVTPTHFCVTLEITIAHLASLPMRMEATGLAGTTYSPCLLTCFVIFCQYP